MKIAISGKSGCGNTTISALAAEKLKLDFINFTFRSLAQEKGINLEKVLELAAGDDYWDREVDSRQVKLAEDSSGCVLGSRLAIWMLKKADFKVYLKARPLTRAKRILKREGGSLESIAAFTAERDRQDHERYLRIYGIDNDDYSFVDMVIDTDDISAEEAAALIIAQAQKPMRGEQT
ncbi:MAG: cytidylate kinase family protein [Treponema sp.]|nr:cytidylate kinase family protein [Treponema sp.]